MIETDKIVIINKKDVSEIAEEILDTSSVISDVVLMVCDIGIYDAAKRFNFVHTFDGRCTKKSIDKRIYRAFVFHQIVAIALKNTAAMLEGVPTTNYVTYKDKESLKKEVNYGNQG